jgi:hypothetical protein
MKNIITEISRIKQMMGIFESLEDDKKISDEYMEYVKNTSVDDQLGKDKERSLELRQRAVEAGSRVTQYKKIENATSLDELRNLFSKDYEFKDYVRNNFCGDEEIDGIIEVLCILNGGSNEEYLGKERCNWHRSVFSNLTIDTNLLDLIPGLKERVSNLKTVKKEEDTVLDDEKQNIENATTQNIENATTQKIDTIETPTISADQYISKLNYSDVGYDNVDTGGSMRKYAEVLSKEDPNEIETLVKSLINRFKNLMTTKINKKISQAGMSESWAYWDVGKQLYFYNNPEESNYKLGNPLTDKWIQQSIINRMIGWEVTNGGKKPNGNKYSSKELANIGETYL